MESIEIFQIDAFTDKVFHGNPAAVCLMPDWLNDELMLAIAVENNLSETAFIIETDQGFHIRWFAPSGEIDLCGHATLAAAFVLFELERCAGDYLCFHSRSGPLDVEKRKERYILNFPQIAYRECTAPEAVAAVVNQPVLELYESDLDYIVLLGSEAEVQNATVDLKKLVELPGRGLIITAQGGDADFYSRGFYPKHSIAEDPVTGSAYCVLAPFWANKLNKPVLRAIQGSMRKGEVFCEVEYPRVYISGFCRWYLKGNLVI